MLFNKEKVEKILNKLNANSKQLLPCYNKAMIVDGIGKIAVIYNGDIEITQKLISLALRTHNQLYLITNNNLDENKKIIDNLNIITKEFDYGSNIIEIMNITHNAFFSIQRNFDCVLVISTKTEYSSITSHLLIDSIFYQYGEYNIFVDDNLTNEQKESLKQIDDIAFENDYTINYINISNFEEQKEELDRSIKSINTHGKNQSISIFTTQQEHSYYFINSLNARNICINSKPFIELIFEENDFICKKNILFI